MSNQSIKCPNCGESIEISQLLAHQIEEKLTTKLRTEFESKTNRAVQLATQKANETMSVEVQHLKDQLAEHQQKSELSKEKELSLNKRARDLEAKQQSLLEEVNSRVNAKVTERETVLRAEIAEQTRQNSALELSDLKQQIQQKTTQIEQAQQQELELRKKNRLLDEKQKGLELEIERRLDDERRNLAEKLSKQYSEQTQLKLREKDKLISDLQVSVEDMKRKSEQASMETQGEVLELDLEQKLREEFSTDTISPVPKGVKGADVVQEVMDGDNGCGKIIWETKNTKSWQSGWLQKLKDDQRDIGANIAILVSVALPNNIRNFGLVEGVWISDIRSYIPLALALREQLVQVSFARKASQGKNDKMDTMFDYLSGDEFKQRVEAIVETFESMQTQLNRERRAMEKIWKEREKQIQRITTNTVGMYGDVRGIIGSSVQEIKALELDDGISLLEKE